MPKPDARAPDQTPFQRFERLTKMLIAVPKAEIRERKRGPKMYPEKKQRDLTEAEKADMRVAIERGDEDYAKLAKKFGCSTSQVAGIKAAMHRP
jgi:hypothetical protein